VDAIVEQAEKRDVVPTDLSLILCSINKNENKPNRAPDWRTRCRIVSLTNVFPEEVVKIRKIHMMDISGAITQSVTKMFEGEIYSHNQALKQNITTESTTNYPTPIALDKLEINIDAKLKPDGEYEVELNVTYDMEFLRVYDLQDMFGGADLDEIEEQMGT